MQITTKLDIVKIILAGFSFIVLYPLQLITKTLFSILLMLPLVIFLVNIFIDVQNYGLEFILNKGVPLAVLFYALLFSFGYALFAINVYRGVILGIDNTPKYGYLNPKGIWGFLVYLSIIQLLLIMPVLLTGISFFYLIVCFIIAPMFLRLVDIALEKDKNKYYININYRLNFTILQGLLPLLIVFIISYLPDGAFTNILLLIVKIFLIYWEAITLALIYQNTTQ